MEKTVARYFCPKHKDYDVVEADITQDGFPSCPKCEVIRKKGLCTECEQHIATVPFSLSTMDWIHGMISNICQCCYVKKVEKAFNDTQENLKKQREELEKNPCKDI